MREWHVELKTVLEMIANGEIIHPKFGQKPDIDLVQSEAFRFVIDNKHNRLVTLYMKIQ